jgi:chromosome partitioning protein
MVLNPKGGCGKSTLATNLAGYYASKGNKVGLADHDPQQSSLAWLEQRPEDAATIEGYAAYVEGARAPRGLDHLIMDVPAGVHGTALTPLLRAAETVLVPVLPSPIDIRAVTTFLDELISNNRVSREQTKVALVGNRVRENTRVYLALVGFLKRTKLPFVGTLRDTQNYIRAAERGLSVFEFAPSATEIDRKQWARITRWLNSAKAQPAPK